MNRPQCLALVPAVLVLLLGPSALGQENPSNDEAMKVFRQEAGEVCHRVQRTRRCGSDRSARPERRGGPHRGGPSSTSKQSFL